MKQGHLCVAAKLVMIRLVNGCHFDVDVKVTEIMSDPLLATKYLPKITATTTKRCQLTLCDVHKRPFVGDYVRIP